MKALLASSLLLLGGIAAAQNAPASSAQPTLQRPGETALAQLALREPRMIRPSEANPRTCAYIHSFIFERNDGEAPRLVKETYCTPTGQFQIKRSGKPGLYPAVLESQPEEEAAPPRH